MILKSNELLIQLIGNLIHLLVNNTSVSGVTKTQLQCHLLVFH